MSQCIEILGLKLRCHVGVPDEELAVAQELLLDVMLEPLEGWEDLQDDIARTIDYAQVAAELEQVAQAKFRRLIETLAVDLVDFLLAAHPLRKVRIRIEKFILPQTRAVAVVLEKTR